MDTDRRRGGFLVAVRFLTRVPTPRAGDADDDLGRASAWFPAVGLVVGCGVAATRLLTEPAIGATAATILAVLVGIVATGAFHEDGLADTADGLWGGSDVERRLEIMRDSRLGSYGVIALTGELALRTTLLASLDVETFVRAVVAAHVLGRLAPLLLAAWLAPARPDGQGVRIGSPSVTGWIIAATVAAAVAAVTGASWAPVLVGLAAATTGAVGLVAHAKLGGTTGDVLGASVVMTGLSVIATFVVISRTTGW